MTYSNELAALREYIARFDPEKFSTSGAIARPLAPTAEQLAEIQRIRARLARKRQVVDSLHHLCDGRGVQADEVILTQAEVDALLEAWSPPLG